MTAAFALAVFLGCSRNAGEQAIVSVNGATLSRAELTARANNIVALFRHKQGAKANEDWLANLRKGFERGYPKYWVENWLVKDYMRREGLEIPDGLLKNSQDAAFANFKANGDVSYSNMVSKLEGFNLDYWNDQVRAEAAKEVLVAHWKKLYPTNVPDSFADMQIAKMRDWNAKMALTNAIQYAKATNVWEKLKAGADFVKTAKENTEIEDEIEDDCEWAIVDEKFLEDAPGLYERLKKLKLGEFTPPVKGDNGLMIVRLDRYEDEGGLAVSRIFFRLPRFLTPAPKEEILAAELARRERTVFLRKLDELVASAAVEYAAKDDFDDTKDKQNNKEQGK